MGSTGQGMKVEQLDRTVNTSSNVPNQSVASYHLHFTEWPKRQHFTFLLVTNT